MFLELVVGFLSLGLTIVSSIAVLAYWLGRKFAEIDARFKSIDARFGSIESKIIRLGMAFVNYQEFFVEFLASEGIIKKERLNLVRGEARRLIDLALANPLTKEEWRRIKELLDKDELTLEEALELRDLARKVIWEYGDRPEAWKLHIYTCIMVGLAMRKKAEEKREQK